MAVAMHPGSHEAGARLFLCEAARGWVEISASQWQGQRSNCDQLCWWCVRRFNCSCMFLLGNSEHGMSLQDSMKFQIPTCHKLLIFFSGRVNADICTMWNGRWSDPTFWPTEFRSETAKTHHAYPWPSNLEPFWNGNPMKSIFIYIYIYMYTYIYIDREREKNEKRESWEDHLSSTRAPCISQEFRRFLSSHVANHWAKWLRLWSWLPEGDARHQMAKSYNCRCLRLPPILWSLPRCCAFFYVFSWSWTFRTSWICTYIFHHISITHHFYAYIEVQQFLL